MYRTIWPLLQKHAQLRGISSSKLVNDILTIWIYNATPREALAFFNTHGPHSMPKQSVHAAFRRWMAEFEGKPADDEFWTKRGISPNEPPEVVVQQVFRRGAFTDNSYTFNANTDGYGITYSLPPFPLDIPKGYLRSIGWANKRPGLNDISAWMRWAVDKDERKMPLG